MKPSSEKKNFSLLWILGGVAVAAGAALLFSRSKRPITNEEYEKAEKDFLEQAPALIEKLRVALDEQKGERLAETKRSLHYYEQKLKIMQEALVLFPHNPEGRKTLYAADCAACELEAQLTE